jgi:thymidylate kinase
MLAARDKKYKVLNYLLDRYKDNKKIIYQKNKKGMTFLHYMNPTDKEYMETINDNPDVLIMMDRFFWSEMVYSFKRGYEAIDQKELWQIEEDLSEVKHLVILCNPPLSAIKDRLATCDAEISRINERLSALAGS